MKRRRTFSEMVYGLTAQVPKGKVTTYGAIARKLGRPKAPRAVGRIMGANPHPRDIVPCHRVVMSDGGIGGYSSPHGVALKVELLRREGVVVDGDHIDLKRFIFTDFRP